VEKELDLGYKSLKNLVYKYIRDQMQSGELKQGDTINMERTAHRLGVSKTPLREALIKLEAEGFVRIIPWRGVFVSELKLQDFKDCYQIIGALECCAIQAAAPLLTKQEVARMARIEAEMRDALASGDFDRYYERNVESTGPISIWPATCNSPRPWTSSRKSSTSSRGLRRSSRSGRRSR